LETKELAIESRQHTVSHFLFLQGISGQKQHACCLQPTPLFSVSPTEDKAEVMEAAQVVLNTPTEHNFQDPKLVFDLMAAPVLENMDTSSIYMIRLLKLPFFFKNFSLKITRQYAGPLYPSLPHSCKQNHSQPQKIK
jgi:hypothetical protein